MPETPNTIICGDTIHQMSPAYIAGARACREEVPYRANPYPDGTQRASDWEAGHDNEAAYEHRRFGKDLLAEPPAGTEFAEDPAVRRDEHGNAIPEPEA